MRVLGYTFDEPDQAWRAQRVITERYGLRPGDAKVADVADNGFVLGVRAREDNIAELARLLRDLGGELVVDVDERRTGLSPHM